MPNPPPLRPSRKHALHLLGLLAAAWLPAQPLLAQTKPPAPDSSKVYVYVEQMPGLSGAPGLTGIYAALQKLVGPAANKSLGNRIVVSFTVGPHGGVYGAKIVRGLNPTADAAVLRAVAQLPRFVPGKQNGRPVAVSFTVPVYGP